MGSNTDAFRAITAVFFRRILKWASIISGAVFIAIFLLTLYLATTLSAWWWILLIPVFTSGIIALVIGLILWTMTNRLLPKSLTRKETRQLLAFTDKIFGIAENARMPYPVMLIMVGKDIIRGKQSSFIARTINNSRTLRSDYEKIRDIL